MALSQKQRAPIMCLTQDGLPWSHVEQTKRLCTAGAQWIQLRMKSTDTAGWLNTARQVVDVCRRHGALCIINDSVEIALAAGADGVHLGRLDTGWKEARERLGPLRVLGGTVNNDEDAGVVSASACLDYAGVGPWRFTSNKLNLSPVLGTAGVGLLLPLLIGLPIWVIGGIELSDVPIIRKAGVAGVALSSTLFRNGRIEETYREFAQCWDGGRADAPDGNETPVPIL